MLLGATAAWAESPEKTAVDDTIAAIEDCYHWGGEVGDESEERNQEIASGADRDCTLARRKALAAQRLYPKNTALAAKLLELIDVGYFDVQGDAKKAVCETALPEFKRSYEKTKEEDPLYSGECPEAAAALYAK